MARKVPVLGGELLDPLWVSGELTKSLRVDDSCSSDSTVALFSFILEAALFRASIASPTPAMVGVSSRTRGEVTVTERPSCDRRVKLSSQ